MHGPRHSPGAQRRPLPAAACRRMAVQVSASQRSGRSVLVYVPVPESQLRGLTKTLETVAASGFPTLTHLKNRPTKAGVQFPWDGVFHITMTRPVRVTDYQTQGMLKKLRAGLSAGMAPHAFDITLGPEVTAYPSFDRSDTFLAVRAHEGVETLRNAVRCTDEILAPYGMEPYYSRCENIHVSFGWTHGAHVEAINQAAAQLAAEQREPAPFGVTGRITVNTVRCRVGSATYEVWKSHR